MIASGVADEIRHEMQVEFVYDVGPAQPLTLRSIGRGTTGQFFGKSLQSIRGRVLRHSQGAKHATECARSTRRNDRGDGMIAGVAECSAMVGTGTSCGNAGPHRIQRLSVDEYAAFQQNVGEKLVRLDGFWWRRVRPCFYRPLVPFREFSATLSRLPVTA